MRVVAARPRNRSLCAAILTLTLLPACTVEAGDEAAHAIAERFADSALEQTSSPSAAQAGDGSAAAPIATVASPASPDPDHPLPAGDARKAAGGKERAAQKADAEPRARLQRVADEAEMLARARAEAEEWRVEQARRLEEVARLAAEEEQAHRAAEARRLAAEQQRAEENRKAEQQRLAAEFKAAEAERLARARAEAEERRVEQARRLEEVARLAAEEEQARRAAEARRLAAEQQLAEEQQRKEAESRALVQLAAARQREQELKELSARLRLIRETHAARKGASTAPVEVPAGPDLTHTPSQDDAISTRVTVLLLMQAGDRGIRRFNKTADPILCVGERCYVSRGASMPAEAMHRQKAFGPSVALVSRAGLCSHSLTCVFRNVDLEQMKAELQPVDLRILRHDRREPRLAGPDPTCRIAAGHLACDRAVAAGDYKLWVVPEAVAEQAGAVALEAAVRSGLTGIRNGSLEDFDRDARRL